MTKRQRNICNKLLEIADCVLKWNAYTVGSRYRSILVRQVFDVGAFIISKVHCNLNIDCGNLIKLSLLENSLMRINSALEDKSPPSKFVLICVLLSSEIVSKISL